MHRPIARVTPQGAADLGRFGQAIDAAIARSTSFEDLRVLLAGLLDETTPLGPPLSGGKMDEVLHQSMVAADMWGRVQGVVDDE